MPKTVITKRIEKYIKANYLKMPGIKIASYFGISKCAVQKWMRKNGYAAPRELVIKWRSEPLKGRTTLSKKQETFLLNNYLTMPVKRIAEKTGKSYTALTCRLKQLGLIIPPEIIEQRKRETRIQPGNVPVNKGKKMSRALYKKCQGTMFKKGNLPVNTKHDGAIAIRYEKLRDGSTRPYKWIRISKANWKMLHVLTWEKKYGPVPKGHIVVFKDKNTMNLKLQNLELITKEENMRRNTIHNLPAPLKETIYKVIQLKRKITKYEKQAV